MRKSHAVTLPASFTERDSAKLFPPGTWNVSLWTKPFRSREAGAAHSTHAGQGDLCLCLHPCACATPTCSDAVLTSTCLFSFAANPTWLSSPGQEHSTPSAASPGYLCSQLWIICLHLCRISLTQPKKGSNPFEARRQRSQLISFSEIYAEIVHASHPQTTGLVVTTPSTKLFLLGPSASRVWISNFQAVASCF